MIEPAQSIEIPKHCKDIRGQKFNRLTVLAFHHTHNRAAYWVCQCECGATTIVSTPSLRSGNTRSCGCLKHEASTRLHSSIVTSCDNCGKQFRMKMYRYNRSKRHYCCVKCHAEHKEITFQDKNNHQYGLRGKLNASYTNDTILRRNNHLTEVMLYVGEWHKHAVNGRVKEHRYLVEKNHHLFDSKYFREEGGWFYLRQGVHVHHIDGDHNNNDLNNLIPLTKAEHFNLHHNSNNSKK